MPYASCNGGQIAYQQLGEGPDVILIHGLAANRAFWYAHFAQVLKRQYRVTLFDLRGHGYSERTLAGYAAQDMALDLAELMAALQIERAHLVGHSYGGGVALELAVMMPQRVSSLCLLDTKINSLQPEQRLNDVAYLSPFEQAVMSVDKQDWAAERHLGLRYIEALARLRVRNELPRAEDGFTPFGDGRGGLRGARQYLSLLEDTRAEAEFKMSGACQQELADLRVPLLLMYGEHSRCLPSALAMQELNEQARFCLVPRAGHFFPMSHGDLVLRELGQFIGFKAQAEAATEMVGGWA